MKPWNTVIFDIDDTLYDQMVPFRKACEAVLGGKGLDAEALYSARGKRGMEALQKVTDGLWTMEQNHIYRTKAGCADLGVAISDEEALRFQQVYAKAQQQLRISPIMAQVLDICTRENWNPGIITNGPADHQRKKFLTLRLDRWILPERVVVSGDCGFLKPAREIFDLAAEKFGLDPKKTLYVGDSYEHDILGAADAGWNCYWLNRRDLPIPSDCPTPFVGSELAFLKFIS